MSLSKRKRFKILTRDAFTCRYCGRSAPEVVLHVDHVHPVSRGGTDDESNLVAACRDCNASKSGLPLPDDVFASITRTRQRVVARADLTEPHVDTCPSWLNCPGGRRMYAAVREEPDGPDYYRAFYRCAHGHSWFTTWHRSHRLASAKVAELAKIPGRDRHLLGAGAP